MNDMTNVDGAGNEQQPDPSCDETKADQRRKGRRHPGQVLNQQQCLAGLSQLPGLLAMNMIKPGQANAMRGAFRDVLQFHLQANRSGAADGLPDEDLLALLRKTPEMFSMLEPLLTDEQIDLVMKRATGGDEQA
jgi:hypothetical protein